MWIVKNRNYFFTISTVLCLLSILAVIVWGVRPGIEFTGGSLNEISFPDGRPDKGDLEKRIESSGFESFSVRSTDDSSFAIRTITLDKEQKDTLYKAISDNGKIKIVEERSSVIGPIIGKELKSKALSAILLTILAIVLFIAYVFRHVSEPVSSWKYGLIAIVALVHDVLIPTGFFAILSKFAGAELDVLFVTAVLTVFGLSINDTIVVFDRIRENLKTNKEKGLKESFEDLVGRSLEQTFSRSISTSLMVILVLLALFIFGGQTTNLFALTLIIGMIAGTYSSIFIASPILVLVQKIQDSKKSSK